MSHRPLRLLALASVLCSATAVSAQEHATDRGSFILGGSAGLASQKVEGERVTFMHLNPAVQYFVLPGLAVGGTISVSHSRYASESSTAYGAGPQIAYYAGGAEQTLRPYVSVRTMVTTLSGGETGVLTYGGNAGLLYLFTRAVGLDASVFYHGRSFTGANASPVSETLGVAIGFSAFAF